MRRLATFATSAALLLAGPSLRAAKPTPGYPEKVLHWTVQKGESCRDIATALYGSAKHQALLRRYNDISCTAPLKPGQTLIVPEKVSNVPTARLRGMYPEVRSRPPGGGWKPATSGMPLYANHSVNTLRKARADILFIDRTRVYLAEHTLVVIYDTAAQSKVAKTPARVELETGEVQAGLMALRGKPMEIDVKGGARVSAASRDAVIRKKKKRSTVSVFDGQVKLSSAGKQVKVPKHFGSSFIEAKPPEPPRPLPPAPRWGKNSSSGVILTPTSGGSLKATWSAVPSAKHYRFEVARDVEFRKLVVREEIPARVRAFRAEQMPPGNYYLRVRAIDKEDFLGIAASKRSATLVTAAQEAKTGRIAPGLIHAHPYGRLELSALPGGEVALDGKNFSTIPKTLDIAQLRPQRLVFRDTDSGNLSTYRVTYAAVGATFLRGSPPGRRELSLSIKLEGFDGIDVDKTVQPKLRAHLASGPRAVELLRQGASHTYSARVKLPPDQDTLRVDLLDGGGRHISSGEIDVGTKPEPAKPVTRVRPPGVTAPPIVPSRALSTWWWAPRAERSAALSATAGVQDQKGRAQAHARAMGAAGDFSVDALLLSDSSGDAESADDAAWLGLRWRAARFDSGISLAPAARVAIPTSSDGTPARAELGLALGGRNERFSWLLNAGGRAPLDSTSEPARSIPDGQGFLLAGATFEPLTWMALYALLDGHALVVDDEALPRGGLSLGLEAGSDIFAGLSLRASPWDSDGGHFFGQLAVGVREPLP